MPLPTMSTPSSRSGASASTDPQMRGRVHIRQERYLYDRHIGLGKGDLQGDENAVIEAALVVVLPR